MNKLCSWSCGCIFAVLGSIDATATTINTTVSGQANIWSAGHATAEALVGGAGTLAVLIEIPGGHDGTLVISSVTGTIDYGACCVENGADGIATSGAAPAMSYRGIAGVVIPRGRFLAGVFLNDDEPVDPAPSQLDMSDGIGFSILSPDLAQSFFIGDGLIGTDAGLAQIINIPEGATRLYLGFHDSFQDLPGYFQDNTGSLTLAANFVVPAPAAAWLLGTALGVMGWMRRKAS